MNNAKVISALNQVLLAYGFSTKSKENEIVFKSSSGWGNLYIGNVGVRHFVEFSFRDKFSDAYDGDYEKERYAGANAFSKYSNAFCSFFYTPPNQYSFTSRMLAPENASISEIENLVRYMICACLEGYSFLNASGYYKNPKERIVLQREIYDNLRSLIPWNNPGQLALN